MSRIRRAAKLAFRLGTNLDRPHQLRNIIHTAMVALGEQLSMNPMATIPGLVLCMNNLNQLLESTLTFDKLKSQ